MIILMISKPVAVMLSALRLSSQVVISKMSPVPSPKFKVKVPPSRSVINLTVSSPSPPVNVTVLAPVRHSN